jgi:hypothetical protein
VPQDVSVTGFDDVGQARVTVPGSRVDALGAAVVVGKGEAGVDRGAVEFEAVGGGVQVGKVGGADGCDPLGELGVVADGGGEERVRSDRVLLRWRSGVFGCVRACGTRGRRGGDGAATWLRRVGHRGGGRAGGQRL